MYAVAVCMSGRFEIKPSRDLNTLTAKQVIKYKCRAYGTNNILKVQFSSVGSVLYIDKYWTKIDIPDHMEHMVGKSMLSSYIEKTLEQIGHNHERLIVESEMVGMADYG